jgi:hypothetical protein
MATTTLPTVEQFVAHAKIVSLSDQEQELLQLYLDSALDYVERYLRVTFRGESTLEMPAAVRHACYMLASDAYEHREAQSEITLAENKYVDNLLHPYRDYFETDYNADNWRTTV